VLIPFRDRAGDHAYHQWWDPRGKKPYKFPGRDGEHVDHGDVIFGIDLWDPARPLVLCEGVFTAMTLLACGLGGSHLTDEQLAIIVSLSPRPRRIVLALDRDDAGFTGAKRISRTLSNHMPEVEVLQVSPPPPNDWNDLAQRDGAVPAMREFVRRMNEAHEGYEGGSDIESRVRQMLG
jgi:DNA primase